MGVLVLKSVGVVFGYQQATGLRAIACQVLLLGTVPVETIDRSACFQSPEVANSSIMTA